MMALAYQVSLVLLLMAFPLHAVLGQQCEVVLTSQDALVKEVKALLDNFEVQINGNISCSNTCEATERKIDILEVYLKNKLDAVTEQLESYLDKKLNATNEQVQTLESKLDTRLDMITEQLETHLDTRFNQTTKQVESLQNQQKKLHLPGVSPGHPASSCADVLKFTPGSPSGYYWIEPKPGHSKRQYCNMTLSCGGVIGGWMRVADLDMTKSSHQCPSGLRLRTDSGKRTCGINSNSGTCSSVTIPVATLSYSKVCGKIAGYQVGSPDTFSSSGERRNVNPSIDTYYVDGVSLTHGNPRQHIWTFAAGLDEDASTSPELNCPCTDTTRISSASPPPAFVGNDYFCDTGSSGRYQNGRFYGADPLWDGAGCGPQNSCCSFNNPPWFYKQLSQPTTNNIEMRLCRDQSSSDEDIAVEMVDIYVQ